MTANTSKRPIALVTGVSRKIGIGAAIALALAEAGWDIAMTYWRPYDATMPWGSKVDEVEEIVSELRELSANVVAIEADLTDIESTKRIYDAAEEGLGSVTALIMAHCHSVDSDINNTSVESFDKHFAINSRATWLLVREHGRRFKSSFGTGRVISITSDHTVGNLPYGASKAAMDRIVLAATHEFKELGITANVINPGATDTGWMTAEFKESLQETTPLGRVGLASDCANLVKFLCSEEGKWINGQLLYSNGGKRG